jgi:hypothetical protein
MDHLAQPDEALATLVDGVMGDLYTGLAALPEPEARRLAFNVLLNGLSFVLEDMRSGAPAEHATYRELAVLALRED